MIKNRYCRRCGHAIMRETVKGLRKEYPYYCPNCYENMYRFETFKRNKKRNKGFKVLENEEINMEIKISLSESDLERIHDVLGIKSYDDIHTAFVEAMDIMLEKEEQFNEENY